MVYAFSSLTALKIKRAIGNWQFAPRPSQCSEGGLPIRLIAYWCSESHLTPDPQMLIHASAPKREGVKEKAKTHQKILFRKFSAPRLHIGHALAYAKTID